MFSPVHFNLKRTASFKTTTVKKIKMAAYFCSFSLRFYMLQCLYAKKKMFGKKWCKKCVQFCETWSVFYQFMFAILCFCSPHAPNMVWNVYIPASYNQCIWEIMAESFMERISKIYVCVKLRKFSVYFFILFHVTVLKMQKVSKIWLIWW